MRIMHVSAGRNWGGKECRLSTELDWLQRNGHDILLVCDPESELAKRAQKKNLPIQTLLMRRRHDLRAMFALAGIARRFRPDVINLHTGVDAYLCAPLKFCGIPTVRLQNIHLEGKQKLSTRLSYRLFSHRIICITQILQRTLIDFFNIPENSIDIVSDCVDFAKFHPACDREKFRKELSIPPETTLIGMISMLRSEKGHRYFIDAAEKILSQRNDVKFVMIGSPAGQKHVLTYIRERLQKLYGQLSNINPIIQIDYRDDIPEIFAALDIFVHPSLSEAQGLVISEAFACRKPVVASNTGGIPERVIDGVTGLLAEPGNSDDLAAKIMRLIESPELRAQFAQAGYERVQQDGSIDSMMEKTLESYRKAIAQTGRELKPNSPSGHRIQ